MSINTLLKGDDDDNNNKKLASIVEIFGRSIFLVPFHPQLLFSSKKEDFFSSWLSLVLLQRQFVLLGEGGWIFVILFNVTLFSSRGQVLVLERCLWDFDEEYLMWKIQSF